MSVFVAPGLKETRIAKDSWIESLKAKGWRPWVPTAGGRPTAARTHQTTFRYHGSSKENHASGSVKRIAQLPRVHGHDVVGTLLPGVIQAAVLAIQHFYQLGGGKVYHGRRRRGRRAH